MEMFLWPIFLFIRIHSCYTDNPCELCRYRSLRNCPIRIKKSSYFLILKEKSQGKPLFSHKTDIRNKKSPDFLILTGELLFAKALPIGFERFETGTLLKWHDMNVWKVRLTLFLPFNIRFTEVVNGKTVRFTRQEIEILNHTLKDMGHKLLSTELSA